MFKRYLSALLAVFMLFSICVPESFAEATTDDSLVAVSYKRRKKNTNTYLFDLGRAYPLEYITTNTGSLCDIYASNDDEFTDEPSTVESIVNVGKGKPVRSERFGGGGYLVNCATQSNDGDSSTAFISTPVNCSDEDGLTIDLEDEYEVQYINIVSDNRRPRTVYLSNDENFDDAVEVSETSSGRYDFATGDKYRYARVHFGPTDSEANKHFYIYEVEVYAKITANATPNVTKLDYDDGKYYITNGNNCYRYIMATGNNLTRINAYTKSKNYECTNKVTSSNLTISDGAIVYGDLTADKLTDGSVSTICAFNSSDPCATIDLGKKMDLSHVEVMLRQDILDDRDCVKVIASNEESFEHYTVLGAQVDGEPLPAHAVFVAQNTNPYEQYRYVRVYEGGTKHFFVLAEIAVYARDVDFEYENALADKVPEVNENAGIAIRMTDNDTKSYWHGGNATIDVGSSKLAYGYRIIGEGEANIKFYRSDGVCIYETDCSLEKDTPIINKCDLNVSSVVVTGDDIRINDFSLYTRKTPAKPSLDMSSGMVEYDINDFNVADNEVNVVSKFSSDNRFVSASLSTDKSGSISTDDASFSKAKFLTLSDNISLAPLLPSSRVEKTNQKPYIEFYVSKDGSDDNDGSEVAPFATIEKAQSVARNYSYDMDGDIIVNVGAGEYNITEPIEFTSVDSGQNGYNVIYRGAGRDATYISGGIKVDNFTVDGTGVWQAYLPEVNSAFDLVVNNTDATMAKTNSPIYAKDMFNNGYGFSYDGFVFSKNDLLLLSNAEDVFVHTTESWIDIFLRADWVKETDDGIKLSMLQPCFYKACDSNVMSSFGLSTKDAYDIENAYELLDEPGEFYFNRKTHMLYYIPRDGESIDDYTAEIPVLDRLVNIRGDGVGNHIKSFKLDGMSFINGNDSQRYRLGAVTDQAQYHRLGAYEQIMVTGTVQVDYATGITIENCGFTNISRTAINFGDGVVNSIIQNNDIENVGDGAVCIGKMWHNSEPKYDKSNELFDAVNFNPIWVSSGDVQGIRKNRYNILSESTTYSWQSDYADIARGIMPWVEIDLQKPYTISDIIVKCGCYQTNFEVLVSNDEDFNTYTNLGSTGANSVYNYTVKGDQTQKYRYVKIQKTKLESFRMSNVVVHTPDVPSVNQVNERCRGNKILNNYIANTGSKHPASPSITAIYVGDTEISNNTIINSSYSAISFGWGWQYYPNCTFMDNNRITNNHILNTNLVACDSGGIYIMGSQINCIVEGNYIEQITKPLQDYATVGLYGENGLRDTIMRNNVIEMVYPNGYNCFYPIGFFVYTGQDCYVHDNYGTYTTIHDNATDATIERMIKYNPGEKNMIAEGIKAKSGCGWR